MVDSNCDESEEDKAKRLIIFELQHMLQNIINRIRLRNLKGLKVLNYNDYYIKIVINKNTSLEEITMFINSFPEKFQLNFFDNFHPQISDPGAYVFVQKQNNNFIYQLGNHGWSSNWKIIDSKDLINYIYKNRNYSSEYFEIYRKLKDAVIGKQ